MNHSLTTNKKESAIDKINLCVSLCVLAKEWYIVGIIIIIITHDQFIINSASSLNFNAYQKLLEEAV